MSKGKYILDEAGEPLEVTDLLEWAKWVEDAREKTRVAHDQVGDYFVSTVFLMLDYSFGIGNKPVLFETMVFKKDKDGKKTPVNSDGLFERYGTKAEALQGHKEIVEKTKLL